MRPIFTVHAGEYIVASEIEKRYKSQRVWIPSKDDGLDLLVTDETCTKSSSLQVKFSKDHLASGKEKNANREVKAGGWWKLNREQLRKSNADLWVLVLCGFDTRTYDFVVIKPKTLAARYDAIAPDGETIQSYLWVTRDKKCWETRGLGKHDLAAICNGSFTDRDRDLTAYLNAWPF